MSKYQARHELLLPRLSARPQRREALLPASTMAQVSSVVIFGDPGKLSLLFLPPAKQLSNSVPDFGEAVVGAASSKTKVICHIDDNICQHGDLVLFAHRTYCDLCCSCCGDGVGELRAKGGANDNDECIYCIYTLRLYREITFYVRRVQGKLDSMEIWELHFDWFCS